MYENKNRTTETQIYESRKSGNGFSIKNSTKRDFNLQTNGFNDEISNHRKYFRTQSTSNNRIVSNFSTNQQRQNGEKKTVKDSKKPLRVFGDWSEFKSSTGKTYFYNCKTEVSQWEKPKFWPSDESERNRKESTTNHNRCKIEEKLSQIRNNQQNGNDFQSNEQFSLTSNNRLPSPSDESSRMSFSSTSSKESSSIAANLDNSQINSTEIQNETKISFHRIVESTQINENEPTISTISKTEREQEIQKFYRAELIQHLTDWKSTQLEKQCLKLFDDYYGYSAKMSTGFTELKALKSNFRVLQIKRNIVTQKLVQCEKHLLN